MPDDLEIEVCWIVELGNALNVAGDLSIGAAGRLRAARTPAERAAIRARLRESIRRTLAAGGIAILVLEEGGIDR
jgi:hypothetical protein